MPVTLTSPVLGQAVDYVYTGPLEDWLLSEGYASRDGYTGAGVSNTGATSEALPTEDPRLAGNREAPYFPATDDANATIANDSTNLTKTKFPNPRFDMDTGGVNDEAPILEAIDPATGPAAGGDVVTLTGSQFTGTTGVTFGVNAGTALEVVSDTEVRVTTPGGVAGAVDVTITNATGSDTLTGGYTYA